MKRIKDHNLSDAENEAVQRAIRGHLDILRRYCAMPKESTNAFQRRKQTRLRKDIPLLESGLRSLRAYRIYTVKE
jgi:hypothetical protein